jgi:hypothetical protein
MDYALSRSDDIPPLAIDHLETPSPLNPLGLKGVGESGTLPGRRWWRRQWRMRWGCEWRRSRSTLEC